LQATGEKAPFSHEQMNCMVTMAVAGIQDLLKIQKEALARL
jgi:ribonuclease PH